VHPPQILHLSCPSLLCSPLAIHLFTDKFDVFASSHLPSAFTWGHYHLEICFRPDPTTLPPFLNYSSLSAGGRTIEELTSLTYSPSRKGPAIWLIFSQGTRATNSPSLTLTSGIEPRQCWAFPADYGWLGIWLSQAIQVPNLTVGHASLSSATAISTPKNVTLWGLKPADSDFCTFLGDVGTPRPNFGSRYCGVHLISGIYKPSHSTPYQNFTAHMDSLLSYFNHMIVEVSGNWGHPTYTCIYHIQIYSTA
jgi:hypothetical protein